MSGSKITRRGRNSELNLKLLDVFPWKTLSSFTTLTFTFHPAKRKHPTRFSPQRERERERERALSSNSATSKRSRDDFLKKKTRNDLDVNRANSTSPLENFRNAFLERGIPSTSFDFFRDGGSFEEVGSIGDIRVPFVIVDIRTWWREGEEEEEASLWREISVPGSAALYTTMQWSSLWPSTMAIKRARRWSHKEERYFATLNPLLLTFSPGCTPRPPRCSFLRVSISPTSTRATKCLSFFSPFFNLSAQHISLRVCVRLTDFLLCRGVEI